MRTGGEFLSSNYELAGAHTKSFHSFRDFSGSPPVLTVPRTAGTYSPL